MPISESKILGKGIYTVSEAARYSGLKFATVNRWVFGYREHLGIVDPDLPRIDGDRAISFLTLIELCLMGRFTKEGLPARKLRAVAEKIAREKEIVHPFAFQRLRTDGKEVYLFEDDEYRQISGKHEDNRVWKHIVEPFFREIEFRDEYAHRWFPPSGNKMVMLDPDIRFGEPVVKDTRIGTKNIINLVKAGDSLDSIAKYYDLDLKQVKAATRFEERLLKTA
ncbi:MAG: DUF433 domain-containing protein [Actinobacteria bacterium]|nr:DUF433 domain-containing protein [Actinomycetota bacterium]